MKRLYNWLLSRAIKKSEKGYVMSVSSPYALIDLKKFRVYHVSVNGRIHYQIELK